MGKIKEEEKKMLEDSLKKFVQIKFAKYKSVFEQSFSYLMAIKT